MTDSSDGEQRRWLLARRPAGRPVVDDFELESAPIPEPGPGEVLLRTLYLSVDPYMRGRMRERDSYAASWSLGEPMQAAAVGEVVTSNHPAFDDGDVAVGSLVWAEYAVANGDDLTPVDPSIAPVSTALGVLGMPGRTAYFGVTELARPRPGDTAVVSAAAGAVGSVAAQLCSMAGARVVGIAGSDRKVEFLTDECGIDAAIDRRQESVPDALDEHCPDGIDVYFDNVGGEITDAVFERLAVDARVAVCGQIALYNEEVVPNGPRKLWTLIENRASVEGFLVGDYAPRFEEATNRLGALLASGDLAYRETVTEGIERAPQAFIGLFEGENVGKQLVNVSDYEQDEGRGSVPSEWASFDA